MSRINEKATIQVVTHDITGQVFNLQEGTVFGIPTQFPREKRVIISREADNYGAPVEQAADERIQMNLKGTRLDSMGVEQLAIATGKQIDEDHLYLLKGANVLYYVSKRKEGDEYHYSPADNKVRLAPRTGDFTSIFGVEVAERFEEEFNSLPKHKRKVTQSEVEANAIKAESAVIMAEHESAIDKASTVVTELTPAQKSAITKAANVAKAAEEAE